MVLIAVVVSIIIVVEKTEDERSSPRTGLLNVISLGTAGGMLEGMHSFFVFCYLY